jgi:hypothetical protein
MDGEGKPMVSKGEATRGATLDERRSTGAARGRGGTRAASMLKHRGESGRRCSSLSRRKGAGRGGPAECALKREGGGGAGGRQRVETAGAGEKGSHARGVSGTVVRGQCLESLGWSGKKGNGLGRGKQCRAVVV